MQNRVCLKDKSGESPWIDRARPVQGRTTFIVSLVLSSLLNSIFVQNNCVLSSQSYL